MTPRPRPSAVPSPQLADDIAAVWTRETLTILRDPFSLIFSLVQPLVFLGLFGPLLAGVAGEAPFGGSSLQWFLPGVVVMITMFGTSMTGVNLQFEIMTGAFERILATPLSRSALMIGRALKELTPLVVQAALITLRRGAVRLRAVPAARGGRAADAGRVRRRRRRAVVRAGDRRAQDRVDLLGGAAVAAVPAADPLRHDAAARDRARLDAGRCRSSTRSRTSSTPSACCSPAPSDLDGRVWVRRRVLTAAVGLWVGMRTIRKATL